MIRHILLWFIARFSYLGIFASMMLGIIGLPIPDELLMAFTGYLVFKGRLTYWLTILTASVGSITGVSFNFLIGYKFGLPLLEKYGRKIHVTPERLKQSEKWFKRFGKFAVTIGYFIPGLRHFTALSAGVSKWKYRTFLMYAVPGGIIWVFIFVTLGWYLGENWRAFIERFHRYTLFFVFAGIALVGIWWALIHRRNKRVN